MVHVVDALHGGEALDAHLVERYECPPSGRGHAGIGERRGEVDNRSKVVPGRGCSSRSRKQPVPSGSVTGMIPRVEPSAATASAARRWLSARQASTWSRVNPSRVAIKSAETPCGTVGNRGPESRIRTIDGVVAGADAPAGHGLDAARHDEVLLAAADTHDGDSDGLLAQAAEPIQRHAGNRVRPTGHQWAQAADTVAVVAAEYPVADDDVIDVGWVESVPGQPGCRRWASSSCGWTS